MIAGILIKSLVLVPPQAGGRGPVSRPATPDTPDTRPDTRPVP